jgi:hypothetical protein
VTRRGIAVLALTFLPAFLSADAPAPAPSAAPRIVVEPASFNFGTVKPRGVVQREFVLRNIGQTDLVIDSVVSSCGCAAILEGGDTTKLKAGASTPLRIRLTAPDRAGRLEESVLIKSNDPAQPALEVKVEAVVAAPRRNPR